MQVFLGPWLSAHASLFARVRHLDHHAPQVNGLRGSDTSIPNRIQFDIYYMRNWSLFLDLKIIFLTVFNGLVNPQAY